MAPKGMTLQSIYDMAIEMGINADPRGTVKVKKFLNRLKKEHEELPAKRKKFFDQESLSNPYSDTRILYGNPKMQVKKVLAGIDAKESEVLLMDRLNQKGGKFDLLISHHPSGHALASLHDVMELQVDGYAEIGVPANVAHALMSDRILEVQRRISPANHNQTVDAAKLLDVPLIAIHTVWDNLGNNFMVNYIGKKEFETVGEIIEHLNELPEYQEAMRGKNGPLIVSGSPKSRAGKIAVFFTGGTNPSKQMYIEEAKAGVGTLIDMHLPEDALQELKKLHVNVINAGHIASDSIGANLYLDQLEKRGVEVVPCSGLIRVKRT